MDVRNKFSEKKDNDLIMLMKFSNSEIALPAIIAPISALVLISMIYITPYSLFISVPLILTFIGGIITENISLDFRKNTNEEE